MPVVRERRDRKRQWHIMQKKQSRGERKDSKVLQSKQMRVLYFERSLLFLIKLSLRVSWVKHFNTS